MMPMVGMFWMAALPLKSGEIRSRPVGDLAADEVGADAERVGIVDAGQNVAHSVLAVDGSRRAVDARRDT